MAFLNVLLVLSTLAAAVPANCHPRKVAWPQKKGCGEINIIFTGFPAFHGPYTGPPEYSPEGIDLALRNNTIDLVQSGYNMHVILQGLEEPATNIADRMKNKTWDLTGVGFGQRGSNRPEVTNRLEDVLLLYRENAPLAPHIFNWSPDSFAAAVKARAPLSEDCTNSPGQLITYEEVCTPENCEKVTVVTNGSLEDLLKGPIPQV
ncbi:unnamed protein product [Clonostachys rosea]|uniref:NADP-dependent oxidoreductase domain-containing protein n=1 Tax=Bionectria ochroleuca TaxID=29856 RepID=A0ABY6TXE4_BIOOC|nr:unnamed protein product [Clonostachys rosea]